MQVKSKRETQLKRYETSILRLLGSRDTSIPGRFLILLVVAASMLALGLESRAEDTSEETASPTLTASDNCPRGQFRCSDGVGCCKWAVGELGFRAGFQWFDSSELEDDTTFGLRGVYRFSERFAIESTLERLETSASPTSETDVTSFDASLVWHPRPDGRWLVFGGPGWSSLDRGAEESRTFTTAHAGIRWSVPVSRRLSVEPEVRWRWRDGSSSVGLGLGLNVGFGGSGRIGIDPPSPPPVSIVWARPMEGDQVMRQQLGARSHGGPERTRILLRLRLKNLSATRGMRLSRVSHLFPGNSPVVPDDFPGLEIGAGAESEYVVHLGGLPEVPRSLALELWFDGFSVPLRWTAQTAPVASSYAFPGERQDLRPDEYWSVRGWHSISETNIAQDLAYDLGVTGWDAEAETWREELAGKSGCAKEDYRIWNKPVYAMGSGHVLGCCNDIDDHGIDPMRWHELGCSDPRTKGTGELGGNRLWIEHDNGEVALYAHLRKNTIPPDICRIGARVEEGDLLGRVGHSGSSSHPHLHVHLQKGTFAPPLACNEQEEFSSVSSWPLVFEGARILALDLLSSPSGNEDLPWARLERHGLPQEVVIDPGSISSPPGSSVRPATSGAGRRSASASDDRTAATSAADSAPAGSAGR